MRDTERFDPCLLSTNNGPVARQLLINKIEEEFNEGKIKHSIFYQVCSLYGILQDRYFNTNETSSTEFYSKTPQYETQENNSKLDNELLQYIKQSLKGKEKENANFVMEFITSCNFLRNIQDPEIGYTKILEVCKGFPEEWTIVHVCKGPRPQTTYSVFREIHEREADIYLTILKHTLSSKYPDPICIRLSDFSQIQMFEVFAKISEKCKEYMQVKAEEVVTHEAKVKYWDNLKELDKHVRDAIAELRAYIFPWMFVFRGMPSQKAETGSKKYQNEVFVEVDKFCSSFNINLRERILLSLACLQVTHLTFQEIEAISVELTNQKKSQLAIQQLLQKFQTNISALTKASYPENGKTYTHNHFPCILIVDEQLDHFYWEELNAAQEMCRVNSLQCLYKLHEAYKHRIRRGYLQVDVKRGACVINPDSSLPKTEMRMGAFFKYWTPGWPLKLGAKATQEELLDDYLKRDCYFYAGHGSGLQHISGKRISKQSIEAVVFLFGCDSTRMSTSGLFGDLIGTHFYYHAAMCPSIVGTILPALDSKMDEISVEILSRWVAPEKKQTAMWDQINSKLWIKQGIIERIVDNDKESKKNQKYPTASLCGALTCIHARGEERYYYNTVPYVCRGLPAWNCALQSLPE